MNTLFKLMTDKIGKDGLCPIFIRSKHNGKGFKYFTGEKCKSEDWDSEKLRIKRSCKDYKRINEFLEKIGSGSAYICNIIN